MRALSDWRLIALDLDGTTLGTAGRVSAANRDRLYRARESGVEFTFATGRHRRGVVDELMRELEVRVPVVTMNGGEVWTSDGKLLARHTLQSEEVVWLLELAREHQVHYWGGTTEGSIQPEEFPPAVEDQTWLKFGYFAPNAGIVQKLWETLEATGRFELSNSHPLNIEVNPRGVTKAAGLQVVADYLQLHSRQVVTMGDSRNDIPMLRWAGLGIAMGNAQPAVKAAAGWVTRSVDENGVAYAVECLLAGRIHPNGLAD